MSGSWSDLSQPGSKQQAPAVDNEFDTLCMQVFTSAPGKLLLAALRKRHFDSHFNPLSPDRALQVRIDNQHFVRELETACDRAVEAISKRKP